MNRIPRFFTRSDKSKDMDSKQKRKGPKLERRNALKNVDYDATTSSPSPSPSPSEEFTPFRTRSLDLVVPFHDRTSFRLEGIDGEIDIICQNLGLSPDDFVIPAAAWEARKVRSSSDLLPRSRLSKLNKFKVDTQHTSQFDDEGASEFPDIFADSLRISDANQGQSEPVESNDSEISEWSGRLGHSVRVRVLNENQSEFPKPVGRGGGGIKGVRPPFLAPPPTISLPAIDNAGSTWDILRSFGPDGDRGSSFVMERELPSDDEEEVDEEILKREEVNEARLRETAILSESCSFTTTSNDDDCSSSTTEPTSNISPNFRFRRTITYWEKGDLLGRGSFGSVYEGIADDGFFFAVKEVSLLDQGVQARQSIYQLEQEIALLSQFEHENIVQYYGTAKDDSKLYIFLELAKVSLLSLYQKYTLRDSQVSAYTRQILRGLKYLHERNVVHRDIKCANILVDANGSVKLADFGLAKATKLNDVKSCKGTACWMAPEVVKSQGYGLAADMWSLGCTVLEMLTRQIPYSHLESQMQAIYRIGKGEPPLVPVSLSEDARDFILKCLQNIPSARPTAAQLLDHPFVKRPLPTHSGSDSPHIPGRLA